MKNTLLACFFLSFLSFSSLAQSRPNPDAPATQPAPTPAPAPITKPAQEDGPIRVLDAPPRSSSNRDPDQPLTWKDRLRLGGSFALSLGTFTNIELAPAAGLQLTDRLVVGGSVVYRYISYRNFSGQRNSDNSYGGRAFAFFKIFENINLNAELETLNVSYVDISTQSPVQRRTNLNSFLAGGSYSTPIGGRFTKNASIVFLYNFSYNRHVNPSFGQQNIYPSGSPLVIRFLFF